MNKQSISIDLPSDIFLALNRNENELKQDIKISLALRLYKLQKITLGKAAQIAGLTKFEMESYLSENQISISNLSLEDIISDIEKLK